MGFRGSEVYPSSTLKGIKGYCKENPSRGYCKEQILSSRPVMIKDELNEG
jgi:hypothetical protein